MSSTEYISCSHCGEEITPDSDFCPHCGVLFPRAGEEQCDTHPGKKASGICIICRTLVCDECGKKVRGRLFCFDHQDVEVNQDWARIFQSDEIDQSRLAKTFLESNGFKVLERDFSSVGFVWDGGGDNPISRSALRKPAKVFVPIPDYLKAKEALEEWQSGKSDTPDPESENSP